ncbi:MAG: TetR/AcrR family transcriptional regulator [Syntrophomonadaceae bacterium]|nr:TetR/AcrR family transcriptional regulator [Syntrophomonadaceae bacterium]
MGLSNVCNTKNKIISATLNIIASEGVQNVTIRKIATIADVNVAAVNYHFGSKDVVITEVLKTITFRLIEAFDCLKNHNGDPLSRIELFINQYSLVVSEHPDIVNYFIARSLNHEIIPGGYQDYLKEEGIELIKSTLREIKPDDEINLSLRALQILSVLSFPIMLGSHVKEATGLDFLDPDVRQTYNELLFRHLLK